MPANRRFCHGSISIGVFITVVALLAGLVGPGLYSLYLRYMSRAANTLLDANVLLQDCILLTNDVHADQAAIEQWLKRAKDSYPNIFVASSFAESIGAPSGSGQQYDWALRYCVRSLQARLK